MGERREGGGSRASRTFPFHTTLLSFGGRCTAIKEEKEEDRKKKKRGKKGEEKYFPTPFLFSQRQRRVRVRRGGKRRKKNTAEGKERKKQKGEVRDLYNRAVYSPFFINLIASPTGETGTPSREKKKNKRKLPKGKKKERERREEAQVEVANADLIRLIQFCVREGKGKEKKNLLVQRKNRGAWPSGFLSAKCRSFVNAPWPI